MKYELYVDIREIMNIYCKNHKVGNRSDIKHAYEYACGKHAGVTRGTGEPYIFHPLRVARFVTEWGFESDVIVAAMLHDIVEDCSTPIEEIQELFGSGIARIVDAVTALSDRDFQEGQLTKQQIDMLSDVRLQTKIDEKALYVKIADRLDNLSTLSGVKEEKRIPKAVHTREIIIPLARLEKAYRFVDMLEELCFQTEHPAMYEAICLRIGQLRRMSGGRLKDSLEELAGAFDPENSEYGESDKNRRYVHKVIWQPRSCISLFRQISRAAENIRRDWKELLVRGKTAFYDVTVVVSNKMAAEDYRMKPHDVFFSCFEGILSRRGFSLLGAYTTDCEKAVYFLVSDPMDNLFRVFVRTEEEYQRYLYGNIIDEDSVLAIREVNEIEPRDTYNEKIKVFRKDGTAMYIDKGATVLDFAFYIHTDLGYHFDYAMVDESQTRLPAYTRLNEGDTITVVSSAGISPRLSWFKYAKTSRAVYYLVRYFQGRIPDYA